MCLYCTLHSAVPQPVRLLQQPYIASIGVTAPASGAKVQPGICTWVVGSWYKELENMLHDIRLSASLSATQSSSGRYLFTLGVSSLAGQLFVLGGKIIILLLMLPDI